MLYIVAFSVLAVIAIVIILFALLSGGGNKTLEQARKYYNQKDWNGVIRVNTKLISNDQYNPLPYYQLGIAYKAKGLNKNALKYFNHVFQNSLTNNEVKEKQLFRELADLHYKENNHDEAIKFSTYLLDEDPSNVIAHYQLGRIHYAKKNYNKAVQHLKNSLDGENKNLDALPYLGIAYYHLMRIDEAYKMLKAAEKYSPDTKKSIYFYMADIQQGKGQNEEALRYYKLAIEKKDHLFDSRKAIAEIYRDLGNKEAAIEAYSDLLQNTKEKKDNVSLLNEIRYSLAEIYRKSGKIQNSLDLWEEISRIDPGFKDVSEKLHTFQFVKREKKGLELYTLNYKKFEELSVKILKKQRHKVVDIEKLDDDTVRIKSLYNEKNQEVDCLSMFSRSTTIIGDLEVKSLANAIREERVYSGYYFVSTSFTEGAKEVSMTLPVDLIEGQKFLSLLNQVN